MKEEKGEEVGDDKQDETEEEEKWKEKKLNVITTVKGNYFLLVFAEDLITNENYKTWENV